MKNHTSHTEALTSPGVVPMLDWSGFAILHKSFPRFVVGYLRIDDSGLSFQSHFGTTHIELPPQDILSVDHRPYAPIETTRRIRVRSTQGNFSFSIWQPRARWEVV